MGEKGAFEAMSQVMNKVKPYIAIVCLQFGFAGMNIISMVSLKGGMSHWVLVVYRHAAAILAIAPFALVLERKVRPKMTKSVMIKILLCGFVEPVLDQNLFYLGMTYTSATFASAMVNLVPAVTFTLAVIFRLEKVHLKKIPSIAKVIGTAITVTGAMVMTLYKGPIVDIFGYRSGGSHHKATTNSADENWVTGTIMLLCSVVCWSSFFIVQSMALKEYPAELSLATLICVAGLAEGGVAAVIMERDLSAWALGFDSRLLAAVYAGIVCSGIAYYVQSIVIKARGPVFLTAFTPMSMVITAALGAMVLAEQVHLGSIIGAAIIVIGLYSVVWGKCKEQKAFDSIICENGKAQELPVVEKTRSSVVDGDDFVEAPAVKESNIPWKSISTLEP